MECGSLERGLLAGRQGCSLCVLVGAGGADILRRVYREGPDVTSELKLLHLGFQAEGIWDGRSTAASLMHFQAPNGSGGTTAFHAVRAALGSTIAHLVGEANDEVQGIRLSVETATGRWHITRGWLKGDVDFVNEATGLCETYPVKPGQGQQSAGAFAVGLLGMPAVETERGAVTIDAVLNCLCLGEDRASTPVVGGEIGGRHQETSWQFIAGLLDEKTVRLKASAFTTASAARKARKRHEEMQGRRREHGQVTTAELDARERRLRDAENQVLTAIGQADGDLEDAERRHTQLRDAAQTSAHAADTAERDVREAAHAVGQRMEERGAALESLRQATSRLRRIDDCPVCGQRLLPVENEHQCVLCRRDAPGLREGLQQEVCDAEDAVRRAKTKVHDAETAEGAARARRDDARREMDRLRGEADAFQACDVAAARTARQRAGAALREARLQLLAVEELRKELRDVVECEKDAARKAAAAEQADKEWKAAEAAADERREHVAKELTSIFAPLLMSMTDEVFDAFIESKKFTPMVNYSQPKNLVHYAGMFNLIQIAWHLTLFTAARTVEGFNLPVFLWLDSPLNGLGAGTHGERQAQAALRAIAKTAAAAGETGQIILTTPQPLPYRPDGLRTTLLDPDNRFIPHITPRRQHA